MYICTGKTRQPGQIEHCSIHRFPSGRWRGTDQGSPQRRPARATSGFRRRLVGLGLWQTLGLDGLFELTCDLLLYDITSTCFERDAVRCEIATRGYSRDSRGDRPQVWIGLVVAEDGLPLGSEVFRGERARLPDGERRAGIAGAEARIAQSRLGDGPWNGEQGQSRVPPAAGAKYIVGIPKSLLHEFERGLAGLNWVTAHKGVDVKLVPSPNGKETFLLARSVDRRAKELAMHERFISHMQE